MNGLKANIRSKGNFDQEIETQKVNGARWIRKRHV